MARKKKEEGAETLDLSKAIRMCLDSGEVELGMRTVKQQAMLGRGQVVVIAANLPAEEESDITRYCQLSKLPVLKFEGTSLELGSVCGKPFPVSALWVKTPGNSPIMSLVK